MGKFIQEYAAVYLTAALESVMEEVLSRALLLCGGGAGHEVTTALLEHGIATSPDLWGIFRVTTCLLCYCDHLSPATASHITLHRPLQPYAHLSSCRTAKGALSVPASISAAPSDTVRLAGAGADKTVSQVRVHIIYLHISTG